MSKMLAVLAMASVAFVTEALAQSPTQPPVREAPARGEEKTVSGEVKSINPAGTEITLTDGTRLVAPPGAMLKPGVLAEGMTVVASYKEENGEKVLTDLAVRQPAASPPTEPRSPGGAPAAPPAGSPRRY